MDYLKILWEHGHHFVGRDGRENLSYQRRVEECQVILAPYLHQTVLETSYLPDLFLTVAMMRKIDLLPSCLIAVTDVSTIYPFNSS